MADIDSAIRGLRVIYGSMLASLLFLGATAMAFRSVIAPGFDSGIHNGLLGLAGLLAVVVCPVAYVAVRRSIEAELQPRASALLAAAEPILGVLDSYRRLALLRAALIEAPALLGTLSYLAGGRPAGLIFAGASATLLLATMPSRESLQHFLDGLRDSR
jgi:hypothetical protein